MNGNKNNYSEWWLAVMPLIDNKSRYLYAVTNQQIVVEIKLIRDERNLHKIVSHFWLDSVLEPKLGFNCNTISSKLCSQIPKAFKQLSFLFTSMSKTHWNHLIHLELNCKWDISPFSRHENWWRLSCFY